MADSRLGIAQTMLAVASLLAQRATCPRLGVGCVLTDQDGRILSAGYNGVPSGWNHCSEEAPCDAVGGRCYATHAESNALLSCRAPRSEIYAAFVTHSPCLHCCKQLVQTGCREIHFLVASAEHDIARDFWEHGGLKWQIHYDRAIKL